MSSGRGPDARAESLVADSVWTVVLVEELLALLRGQSARHLAARQVQQVVEVHDVHATGAVAAGGRQPASVGAPGHTVDRRGVARKRQRLLGAEGCRRPPSRSAP